MGGGGVGGGVIHNWKKQDPTHRQTISETGTGTTNTSQANILEAEAKQRLTRSRPVCFVFFFSSSLESHWLCLPPCIDVHYYFL